MITLVLVLVLVVIGVLSRLMNATPAAAASAMCAGWLAALPRTIETILYRRAQASVAVECLDRLTAAHENSRDLTGREPAAQRSERAANGQRAGRG